MDLKEIKAIIDLMKRSELTEFEVEEEGFKIKIKRNSGEPAVTAIPLHTVHPFAPAPAAAEAS